MQTGEPQQTSADTLSALTVRPEFQSSNVDYTVLMHISLYIFRLTAVNIFNKLLKTNF